MENYISVTQAAETLGVSRQTILYHIKKKHLAAFRKKGAFVIFPRHLESIRNLKPGVKKGTKRKKSA